MAAMDRGTRLTIVDELSTPQVDNSSRKQEGVVRLDQARAAGMSDRQIEGKVRRGEWRRSHRGVFIDNCAPVTPLQPVVAAFFAVGGLASHRLALWIWALTSMRTPDVLEFT